MNVVNPEQQQLAVPQVHESTTTRHKNIKQLLEKQFICNRSDRLKEEFQEEQQRLVQISSDLRGRQGDLSRNIVQNITTQRQQLEQAYTSTQININQRITSNEINQTTGQHMLNQLKISYDEDSIALQNRQTIEATRLQGALNEEIRDATQKQIDHLNEYNNIQSSIDSPPDYEKFNPSVLPRSGSNYYQRLRSKKGISLPYNHEKLIVYELLYRGMNIKADNVLEVEVNRLKMKHQLRPDMWSINLLNNFVSLIEDDPIHHACLTGTRYYTQVGRDKYIMEWLVRNGKTPLLLRYLHKDRSTNYIPHDLVPWFIQFMVLTGFDGASDSIVALVSIGPVKEVWYPRIRQYVNTFSGKGGCRVLGFELYVRNNGRPVFKIIDYSDPVVLNDLMIDSQGVDWSVGK